VRAALPHWDRSPNPAIHLSGFYLASPNPATAYPANTHAACSNATTVAHTADATIVSATTVDRAADGNAANAKANTTVVATIVTVTTRCYGCGGGSSRMSISPTPTSCGLGAFKGKKRRGNHQGGGYCSYAHLVTPFGYSRI
jgi:hypothetical protein